MIFVVGLAHIFSCFLPLMFVHLVYIKVRLKQFRKV